MPATMNCYFRDIDLQWGWKVWSSDGSCWWQFQTNLRPCTDISFYWESHCFPNRKHKCTQVQGVFFLRAKNGFSRRKIIQAKTRESWCSEDTKKETYRFLFLVFIWVIHIRKYKINSPDPIPEENRILALVPFVNLWRAQVNNWKSNFTLL